MSSDHESEIEMFKIKKLIKHLSEARGNGTSMISLVMPPKSQLALINKMLADEYGTASNIKSRVNRLSVLSAITSAQQRLKLYKDIPKNGLVLYTGMVDDHGKEKKVTIDFEPFRPISTSLYMCDSRFHTECLSELLANDDKFGFIVMDGNGCLFGTLCGNTREVLQTISVELPKKHGRGGQSAVRFARLREEKRHNYVRKVSELSVQNFISNDLPNVQGLILAGSADFKTVLDQSDLFDSRLKNVVIKIVDTSYGGLNGFNQAIALSSEVLKNVKFVKEKQLLEAFFEQISKDTGKYVFGVEDTLKGLDMGAVETLIVFENLDMERLVLRDIAGQESTLYKTAEDLEAYNFKDSEGNTMELVSQEPLVEWLAENYKDFGTVLEFVTDKSGEGSQFVQGMGGIGGLLRYQVDFVELNAYDEDSGDEWLTDEDFI